MKRLNNFIKWFLYITTIILIVCAVNITIDGDEMISAKMLWQIILSGFITAFITEFLKYEEKIGKSMQYIKMILHYMILCVVMIICGTVFGWMRLEPAGIMMMVISVAAVYVLTYTSYYIIDIKQANEINKKLKEMYGERHETECNNK